MGGMSSLELLDGGVPGDGSTIHLQPRQPRTLLNTHLGPIVLLLAVHGAGPFVHGLLSSFWLFSPLLRDHLPFLQLLFFSLLLEIWNREQTEISCGRKGETGRNLGLRNVF